VHVVKTVNE